MKVDRRHALEMSSVEEPANRPSSRKPGRGATQPLWRAALNGGVSLLGLFAVARGAMAQSFNTVNGTFSAGAGGLPIGLPIPGQPPRTANQQTLVRLFNGTQLPPRNCAIPDGYYHTPTNASIGGPECFRQGPSFQVADNDTQVRVDTYVELGNVLWPKDGVPTLADFVQAFNITFQPDEIGERLDRRKWAVDKKGKTQVGFYDDSISCRYNETAKALYPELCHSGAVIRPELLKALMEGALDADHARFYGGVVRGAVENLWDESALSESYTCRDDPQDCVSFVSYLGVKNAPGFPLRGLAKIANITDPTVLRSLLDAEEGLACLRARDTAEPLIDTDTLSLLNVQVNTGLARLMALRLGALHQAWQAADDKAKAADLAGDITLSTPLFIHRAGDLVSPALAAQLTDASVRLGNFTLGTPGAVPPTPAEADALLVALDAVTPCA